MASTSKFRSSSEERVAAQLEQEGVAYDYEVGPLDYFTKGTYLPDFRLPNGIIIEVKGYFDDLDRKKIDAVLKANPGIDLRFVFDNASTRCRKGRPGNYGSWCDRRGIPYAEKRIPKEWLTS